MRENDSSSFIAKADANGSEWDVVLIEEGFSKNRGEGGIPRYYPGSVLRDAVNRGVFNNVRAKTYRFGGRVIGSDDEFNHAPQEARDSKKSFAENSIGYFKDVRYGSFKRPNGTSGNGVIGRLVILEGAESLKRNMVDAWSRKQFQLYGLSIDASGSADVGVVHGQRSEIVNHLHSASSTDIVSEPAAGGSLLRLAASLEGEVAMEKWSKLKKLLESRRKAWVAGIPQQAPGQTDQDHFMLLCESASELVKTGLVEAEAPADELAEMASDMKALKSAIMLLKAGKTEEAMQVLMDAVKEVEPEEPPAPPTQEACDKEKQEEVQESGGNDAGGTEVSEQLAEAIKIREEAEAELKKLRSIRESAQRDCNKATIEAHLGASGLRDESKARVRQRFAESASVTPEQVQQAITDEKAYIALFSESGRPTGLGGAHTNIGGSAVQVTQEKREKLSKAMDGMIANEDIGGIPAFRSFSESWVAYGMPYGPKDMMGAEIFGAIGMAMPRFARPSSGWNDSYDPVTRHLSTLRESWSSRAPIELRESISTADWSYAFGDSMFRRLQAEYNDDPLNDWKMVASITNLSDWTNPFRILRHGAVGTLSVVNEGAPYQDLSPATPTEEVQSIDPSKYGGLQKLTMEDVIADSLRALQKLPRNLARASSRTIHELVWDIFENNTTIQGNALVSAANSNLVSGNPALTADNLALAQRLLREQTELGSGKILGLTGKYLITGYKLEQINNEITGSAGKQNSTEDATVLNYARKLGIESLVTSGVGKTATTQDYWWLVADKRDCELVSVGFPGGRDRPDIFVQGQGQQVMGSVFDADVLTFKVRLVAGATPVDFRGVAGSQAT